MIGGLFKKFRSENNSPADKAEKHSVNRRGGRDVLAAGGPDFDSNERVTQAAGSVLNIASSIWKRAGEVCGDFIESSKVLGTSIAEDLRMSARAVKENISQGVSSVRSRVSKAIHGIDMTKVDRVDGELVFAERKSATEDYNKDKEFRDFVDGLSVSMVDSGPEVLAGDDPVFSPGGFRPDVATSTDLDIPVFDDEIVNGSPLNDQEPPNDEDNEDDEKKNGEKGVDSVKDKRIDTDPELSVPFDPQRVFDTNIDLPAFAPNTPTFNSDNAISKLDLNSDGGNNGFSGFSLGEFEEDEEVVEVSDFKKLEQELIKLVNYRKISPSVGEMKARIFQAGFEATRADFDEDLSRIDFSVRKSGDSFSSNITVPVYGLSKDFEEKGLIYDPVKSSLSFYPGANVPELYSLIGSEGFSLLSREDANGNVVLRNSESGAQYSLELDRAAKLSIISYVLGANFLNMPKKNEIVCQNMSAVELSKKLTVYGLQFEVYAEKNKGVRLKNTSSEITFYCPDDIEKYYAEHLSNQKLETVSDILDLSTIKGISESSGTLVIDDFGKWNDVRSLLERSGFIVSLREENDGTVNYSVSKPEWNYAVRVNFPSRFGNISEKPAASLLKATFVKCKNKLGESLILRGGKSSLKMSEYSTLSDFESMIRSFVSESGTEEQKDLFMKVHTNFREDSDNFFVEFGEFTFVIEKCFEDSAINIDFSGINGVARDLENGGYVVSSTKALAELREAMKNRGFKVIESGNAMEVLHDEIDGVVKVKMPIDNFKEGQFLGNLFENVIDTLEVGGESIFKRHEGKIVLDADIDLEDLEGLLDSEFYLAATVNEQNGNDDFADNFNELINNFRLEEHGEFVYLKFECGDKSYALEFKRFNKNLAVEKFSNLQGFVGINGTELKFSEYMNVKEILELEGHVVESYDAGSGEEKLFVKVDGSNENVFEITFVDKVGLSLHGREREMDKYAYRLLTSDSERNKVVDIRGVSKKKSGENLDRENLNLSVLDHVLKLKDWSGRIMFEQKISSRDFDSAVLAEDSNVYVLSPLYSIDKAKLGGFIKGELLHLFGEKNLDDAMEFIYSDEELVVNLNIPGEEIMSFVFELDNQKSAASTGFRKSERKRRDSWADDGNWGENYAIDYRDVA